ncbi:MAG TPA: DUF4258 domain-containing protein [archaeon]|nr:DUF4258 domain-containing protein [archaeon]
MEKILRYTKHSIERKDERDISENEIKETLENPDYTLTQSDDRKIRVKMIGNRIINVVYKEEKSTIIIITVY